MWRAKFNSLKKYTNSLCNQFRMRNIREYSYISESAWFGAHVALWVWDGGIKITKITPKTPNLAGKNRSVFMTLDVFVFQVNRWMSGNDQQKSAFLIRSHFYVNLYLLLGQNVSEFVDKSGYVWVMSVILLSRFVYFWTKTWNKIVKFLL